ncbi:MAG: roadblock/LC7 domain-containing protein [Promethearchaeota archaeon]|jgi:predicted regulator of Ras-like GTPase activity (Roadblock/LC7/MglB family)
MAELTPDEAQSLSTFLSSITEYSDLEALALITREGLRLAFSAVPGYNIDPDLFSSLSAVVVQSGYDAISSLGYINMLEVILRGDNGFIILSAAGRFFLMGASRQIGELGKVVKIFRYYSKNIADRYPLQD